MIFLLLLAAPLGVLLGSAPARAQPSSVGHLESGVYPIRVHYPTEAHATTAATVLAEAERTWEAEVLGMGFDPPMTEDASGASMYGLWIYLVAGAESAHAEAISDVAGTTFTDCTTRVLLPADLPDAYIPTYVAHECHHAMEMAVDCIESPFAFENTTVAVTVIQFPEEALWLTYFLPVFQSFPHLGVDCTFFGNQTRGYYHYGASLFQVFLDEWLGAGDGRLLPRFWRAARQEGTVTVSGGIAFSTTPNEPDLLDGIAAVLEEEGTTLAEAFTVFAQWRLFVGTDDDGGHFANGDLWTGGEVSVDTSHSVSQLPVVGAEPNTLPQDYGTTYLEMDVRGVVPPMGVVFSFAGDTGPTWHVDALRFADDGSAMVDPVPIDADGHAQTWHGDLGGVSRLVWAITALGDETHDADHPDCSGGHGLTYDLRLEDTDTAPEVYSVDPDQLERDTSIGVSVTGAGFLPGITAQVEGSGVHVFSVQRNGPTELWLVITVDAQAAPGPRTLTLTNPNGHRARAENALTVVSEPPTGGGGGCGCQGAGSTKGSCEVMLFLAVLLGIGLFGRRRRRAGTLAR